MYRKNWVNVCKKIPVGAYNNEYVVKEKIHVIGLIHVNNKNSNKRLMVGTIIREKKGRPKDAQFVRTKKRERVSPFHGRKLSHPHSPSNVAYMQIVRSYINGTSKTSITCQHNIFSL